MASVGKLVPELLLCGYEAGGTTLLSDIFRSNGCSSGFECGVLMCKDPKGFKRYKPYKDMLYDWWGIEQGKFNHLFKNDFEYFYSTLIAAAFPEGSPKDKYFDKTPIYMSALGSCLDKAPFINKAVVIHRDPRAFFVSTAKRSASKEQLEGYILSNFDKLAKHYLHYFTGSAAHLTNPDVLFIPFEELCTRESSFLKVLGNFSTGKEFQARTESSKYSHVVKQTMDLGKVYEFKKYISPELEHKILEKTKLAAVFFADPYDRVKYLDVFNDVSSKIDKLLEHEGLPRYGCKIKDVYFEPFTYLLRYNDVLNAGMNPMTHFQKYGKYEGRYPS